MMPKPLHNCMPPFGSSHSCFIRCWQSRGGDPWGTTMALYVAHKVLWGSASCARENTIRICRRWGLSGLGTHSWVERREGNCFGAAIWPPCGATMGSHVPHSVLGKCAPCVWESTMRILHAVGYLVRRHLGVDWIRYGGFLEQRGGLHDINQCQCFFPN